MEYNQLYVILSIQIVTFGFIFYLHKALKKEIGSNQFKKDLIHIIQNQGQNFNQTMIFNNDNLSKNFGELKCNTIDKLHEFQRKSHHELNVFKESLSKDLEIKFLALNGKVEEKLDKIDDKVQENLREGFKRTTETFEGIIQRLAKIDEAQKKIESLSVNVIGLQDILTDKKVEVFLERFN